MNKHLPIELVSENRRLKLSGILSHFGIPEILLS